ncbi:hypothetical protein GUJ93_ZPchr0002g23063 [Zizania palustris]|uniref:Uncharacterized protein n=1 Tax=Zizania palustris TaxID=103762 RepID=A0A8J5RX38_ZIZPA|nr:hypothetical protein GUJ93_ZPchr0002g23063 [Zizania palustris]
MRWLHRPPARTGHMLGCTRPRPRTRAATSRHVSRAAPCAQSRAVPPRFPTSAATRYSLPPRLLRLATRLPPQQQPRFLAPRPIPSARPVVNNSHVVAHAVRANKSPQVPTEAPYAPFKPSYYL